jgi:ketosteroid isomerase-like protein
LLLIRINLSNLNSEKLAATATSSVYPDECGGNRPTRPARDTAPAMAQEDLEALRAEYAAMSRKDWDAVLIAADRDFQLLVPGGGLDAATVRGVEPARRAFADFFSPFEAVSVEAEAFFEGDGQIVVFFLQRARPIGSSGVVETRAAHLWTMHDGMATRLEIFPQRERALEAAGLVD